MSPTLNKLTNFTPQQGPAPAPEAQPERTPNLFPSGEREVRAYSSARRHLPPRAEHYTGELRGDCANCKAPSKPITEFAPGACHNNLSPAFFEAPRRVQCGVRGARFTIGMLRTAYCPPCNATSKKLSPMEEACRQCWIDLRQEACARGARSPVARRDRMPGKCSGPTTSIPRTRLKL